MTSTPPTGRRSTPSSKITQNVGGCSRVRIDWRSMRAPHHVLDLLLGGHDLGPQHGPRVVLGLQQARDRDQLEPAQRPVHGFLVAASRSEPARAAPGA